MWYFVLFPSQLGERVGGEWSCLCHSVGERDISSSHDMWHNVAVWRLSHTHSERRAEKSNGHLTDSKAGSDQICMDAEGKEGGQDRTGREGRSESCETLPSSSSSSASASAFLCLWLPDWLNWFVSVGVATEKGGLMEGDMTEAVVWLCVTVCPFHRTIKTSLDKCCFHLWTVMTCIDFLPSSRLRHKPKKQAKGRRFIWGVWMENSSQLTYTRGLFYARIINSWMVINEYINDSRHENQKWKENKK